ncbi:MAG: O-antigen ligase family protein [bacterium]|nr:O-antigen ligase family protein [bacterium]
MEKLLRLAKDSWVLFSRIRRRQDFFKYCTALLLLVIPLYPKFPLFGVPGTHVAIRIEDFVIAVIAVIWFWDILRHEYKTFFKDRINQAILLFLFVGFLSVISAIFITRSVSWHLALLHWARRIEYLIPFFVAITAIKRGAKPLFFVEVLLISSFIAFLFGWGQIHAGFPVISTQNEEYAKGLALRWIPGSRLHSTFAGHYDLAAFLVLVFPIVVAYFFTIQRLINRFWKFLFFLVPSFWLFLQTESRVSFISYMLATALTLWVIKKRRFIAPMILLSILGMFLLSDLGARYWRTIKVYTQKVSWETFQAARPVFAEEDRRVPRVLAIVEDRSTSIRFNVEWPRAFRSFFKNPLLGTGFSSITLATDSDYLRLLGEVGIVGTLAFLLVIMRILEVLTAFLRKVQRLNIEKAFIGGFVGSLAGLLVTAFFIDVFEASKVAIVFWTLAGIAVGTAKKETEAHV